VDQLPSALADNLSKGFSVILTDVDLGVAIVAELTDRGIFDLGTGRGDLDDFFEHFFSFFCEHTTPAVWMCASDQEKNESSHNWNRTSNIETRKPKGFASEIKIFLKSESSKRTFRIVSSGQTGADRPL
jgi:hypothetical protein